MFEYAFLKNPFADRVVCGSYGRAFGRRVWNSTDDRLRRIIWRCIAKDEVKGRGATIKILTMRCYIRLLWICIMLWVRTRNISCENWGSGCEAAMCWYDTRRGSLSTLLLMRGESMILTLICIALSSRRQRSWLAEKWLSVCVTERKWNAKRIKDEYSPVGVIKRLLDQSSLLGFYIVVSMGGIILKKEYELDQIERIANEMKESGERRGWRKSTNATWRRGNDNL